MTATPASLTPNSTQMAHAIRALAMDAVQAANSGHPGAPMGMAEIGVALWARHLKHNPANPHWADRDRFVLSNGHGSMLIYALLHLTGYDLPIDELKAFRQLHSKTPGHPEVGITPGIETTTGPLGQGITNAVGMALAEKLLAAEFNRPGHEIVNHHTYAFLGDGCLMEGISHEACALAGAWKLNKLIALYDDNGISIDGKVAPWFIDDTPKRFEAYGWQVIGPIDGHDVDAVDAALTKAKRSTETPTLIVCKTSIGKGSPNRANTAKAHGEPLGGDEIKLTREAIGWSHDPFVIPEEVYADWSAKATGAAAQGEWDTRFAAYQAAFPELAAEFTRRMAGELPANFAETAVAAVAAAHDKAETVASRKASQIALEFFTAAVPELLGGSADLTGSNLTNTKSTPALRFNDEGAVVLTEGKPGYVAHVWANLEDAVRWIVDAGGVAVIAHPARYDLSHNEEYALFSKFKELGGQGVEVVTGSHTPQDYSVYAKYAVEFGLAASCGSDFHAPAESRDLGGLPPIPAMCEPVWRRLQAA